MDRDGSLARNVLAAPQMLYANASRYFEDVVHFEPDVVISDFDSFAWFFAKRHGLPDHLDRQPADHRALQARQGHQGGGEGRLPDHQGVRESQAPRLRPLRHHDVLLPADTKKFQDDDDARAAHPAPRDHRGEAARAVRQPRARLPDVDERQDAHPDVERDRRASGSSSTACASNAHHGQLPAQGVQRGGLRRGPRRARRRSSRTAGSRSSARRCTSASPSTASR